MTKESYRFVVCVDVEASSLEEGYQKLLLRMNGNDWESTDEVYYPNGEAIEDTDLQLVREVVLQTSDEVSEIF